MSSIENQSIASTSGAQNNNESLNSKTDVKELENFEMNDDTRHADDASDSEKVIVLCVVKNGVKKDPSETNSNFRTDHNQARAVEAIGKNGHDNNDFQSFRERIIPNNAEEESNSHNSDGIESFGTNCIIPDIVDETLDSNQQSVNGDAFQSFEANINQLNPDDATNNRHNISESPRIISNSEGDARDKSNKNLVFKSPRARGIIANTENEAQDKNSHNNVFCSSRENGITSTIQNEDKVNDNYNTGVFQAERIIPNASGESENNKSHNCYLRENTEGREVVQNTEGRKSIQNIGGRKIIPNTEGSKIILNAEERMVFAKRMIDQSNSSYNGNSGQNKRPVYKSVQFQNSHQSGDSKYERSKMETESDLSDSTESDDEEMTEEMTKILSCFVPVPPGPEDDISPMFADLRVLGKDLNRPVLQIPKGKGFVCLVCGLISSSTPILAKHINEHTRETNLECPICFKRFDWRYSFRTHMALHGRDIPTECRACGIKARSATAMQAHWEQSHGDLINQFRCELCEIDLRASGKCVNPNSHQLAKSTFSCEICNNRYLNKRALRVHYRVHLGKKPYECGICDTSYALTSSAIAHQKVHSSLLPFHCDICNNDFVYKNALSTHTCYERESRPYECKICKKTFVSQKECGEHVCGQQAKYCCKFCGKAFLTQTSMNQHIKMHVVSKPYTCAICDETFAEKQELKIHIENHTNLSIPYSHSKPTATVSVPDEYDEDDYYEDEMEEDREDMKEIPHAASNTPALTSPYNANQNKMTSHIEISENNRSSMLNANFSLEKNEHHHNSYLEHKTLNYPSQHLDGPLHSQGQNVSSQVSHGVNFTSQPSCAPQASSQTFPSNFTPQNNSALRFTSRTPIASALAPHASHAPILAPQLSYSANLASQPPRPLNLASQPPRSNLTSHPSRAPQPTFGSQFVPPHSVASTFILQPSLASNLVLQPPRAAVFATQPTRAQNLSSQTGYSLQTSHIPQYALHLSHASNLSPQVPNTLQYAPQPSNVPLYTSQHSQIQSMYANNQAAIMSHRSCMPNGNPVNYNSSPLNVQTYGGSSQNRNSAEMVLLKCKFCRSLFHSSLVLRSHLLDYHRIDEETVEMIII